MASTGSITLARRGLAALNALTSTDPEQQRQALEGWPGWGPLAPAFDPQPDGSWTSIADQLHQFFADNNRAYNAAAECVDNSFYTPPKIIDAIYGLLRAAGFTGGTILEPGCGSGTFISRCPTDWNVQFVGVESDPTSARIAAALNPQATILCGPLEKTNLARDFDAVIGNVPFSSSTVRDPANPLGHARLHNYFLWRALDCAREGGYVILITSRHSMDGEAIERIVTGTADFIGAVRLPTGAFHSQGTDVVADVLVLRKNTIGPWASGARLASAGKHHVTHPEHPHRDTPVHGYFGEHPEHVAGQMIATGYQQNPLEVRADNIPAAITRAFTDLTNYLLPMTAPTPSPAQVDLDIQMFDEQGRKEGSYQLLDDGRTVRIENGSPVEIKATAELRALIRLRDQATALLEAEADYDTPTLSLTGQRAELLAGYTSYVAKYGPLNRGTLHQGSPDPETGLPSLVWRRPTMGGFRRDPDYITVLALEAYDDETGHAEPAAILLRRVNQRPIRATSAANPAEAMAICLGEGRFDLDRIAGLLNLTGEDATIAALGDLIYTNPLDGTWVPARDYLSGNIRTKLAQARTAAERDPAYQRNVQALLEVLPPDRGPLEIAVALGVPWIQVSDVGDFMEEVFGRRPGVEHCSATASWEVNATYLGDAVAAKTTYGTARINGYRLVEMALNGKAPVVYDESYNPATGRMNKTRNHEQTLAAQEKLTAIQDRFATWVWEDAARSARVCTEYNRLFNSHVARSYATEHLTLDGLAADQPMWPSQLSIIDQACSSRSALCGHAPGGGKTRSMVGSAIRARRLGLANKPLIVVPNHLLEQITREARQAFPAAAFLMVSKDDLAGDRRRLFAARCATGDWDAVIITHAGFTSLPVLTETETAWLQEQKYELNAHLRSEDGGYYGAKQIARKLRALESKLADLRFQTADPNTVAFEHLGIDFLLIDEAHYFKRLPITSRMEGFSFGASKRATDLLLKSRLLYRRRGELPCLALFTGTPWSNTLAETFVWQTYLQPEALAEAGVASFDTWGQVFVVFETVVEVAPDGSGFRTATRPMRMRNVPELKAMLHLVADVRSATALGLPVPERADHILVAQQSDPQRDFVLSLVHRADRFRAGIPDPENDNMLVICGDGRRVALDPRLVGIDEDSPKIQIIANTAAGIYHQYRDVTLLGAAGPGVLQVIFCDQGTPGAHGSQSYGRIRQALIGHGVPAHQIRWVHEAKDDKAKEALFAACRDGSVSVLLGSTDKLGVGTNIQQRLRALHHADAPWRPSDVEQRDGRGIRPANLNPLVDIYRYVTEGTFDAYMWQTLARKAVFISQMYDLTDTSVRELGDIGGDMVLSFTEVKALAAGNPLLLEQAEITATIRKLRILRSVDAQAVHTATRAITQAEREIGHCTTLLKDIAAAERKLAAQPVQEHDESLRWAANRLHTLLTRRASSHYFGRIEWGGLQVDVEPDRGWWEIGKATHFTISLELDYQTIREARLPLGAFRRSPGHAAAALRKALFGMVQSLPEHKTRTRDRIKHARTAVAQARAVIDSYEFAQADELAAAEARLARIEAAIALAVEEPAAAAA
jgi:N12 class adenine-specific DNA methylase